MCMQWRCIAQAGVFRDRKRSGANRVCGCINDYDVTTAGFTATFSAGSPDSGLDPNPPSAGTSPTLAIENLIIQQPVSADLCYEWDFAGDGQAAGNTYGNNIDAVSQDVIEASATGAMNVDLTFFVSRYSPHHAL
eukprot:TRINITY_DN8942_c0_g1_i1.p1 TRINITY_DN8942_c0_g1~~TRINITY_DN8942_c0_g1_i1.p1  ORF type:complete len:135 (+),score=18.05 TRINITY_DN8942_c0_g1_i1:86-490(+)